MGQTIQRSSGAGRLDASAQLAAETEGSASAQDGQGAGNVAKIAVKGRYISAGHNVSSPNRGIRRCK
jgi:hypothetical protein